MMKKKQRDVYHIVLVGIAMVISIYLLYILRKSVISIIVICMAIIAIICLSIGYIRTKNINCQKAQMIIFISSIFSWQAIENIYSDVDHYIGIDVSHWNSHLDMKVLIEEIDFIILSCGYTSNEDGKTSKTDPLFEQNIKQCIELNIPYGIYYYSLATTPEAATEEAEYVLSLIEESPPLGIYIDIEDEVFQGHLTKEEATDVALAFVETIESNYHQAGVYANHYWWNHKLDEERLSTYIKWIAFYNDTYEMEEKYHLHQFTDEGILQGAAGFFDLNIVKEKFW